MNTCPRLVLAAALAACASSAGQAPEPEETPAFNADDDLVTVELATVGMDLQTQAPIVLLRDAGSGKVVPIWVGLEEARAIARALHGIETPRPMTHDLLASVVHALDASVEEVVVHDVRDGVYYGVVRLLVGPERQTREIDSRPSDAMALALRTGARIRVVERILEDSPDFDFVAPEGEEQVVHTMGITVVANAGERRRAFGLPDRDGVIVIQAGGEARARGLQEGDLIVEVNGSVPSGPMDFFDMVRAAPAGQPVALRYWRDGAEHTLELPPARHPVQPPPPRPGQVQT